MARFKLTYNDLIKIGTLCHNRTCSPKEIAEYVDWDSQALVRALMRRGWLMRVERGEYFPTPLGWKKIEIAGKVAFRFLQAPFKD